MASWPPPERPRTNVSQLPYLRGLDGMRALAVGAVMVYHANHEWLGGGFLGVEIFFVISGYLITLLMIGEHERDGRLRLGQFWKRRARRLLPALFVLLIALATYLAIFYRRPQGRSRGDFLAGIFYGSNWYQIAVGQGYTAAEAFAPLRHLWSLAVEEQFYLLWPLVMMLILRRGRDHLPKVALWLVGISAAIAVATAVLFVGGDVPVECGPGAHGYVTIFGRCVNVNEALYLGTFSRAGGLLLGAAFAMWFRPLALLRGPMRRKGHLLDLVALAGLAVLGLQMWWLRLSESGVEIGERFDPWLFRGGFFITGLATLAVIAAVVHRRAWMGRILGNPLFNWIGTRSYGLYLFHWPVYQIIRKSAGVSLRPMQFVVALAITLPITELSYRLIEMPIRQGRLRRWLRSEATLDPARDSARTRAVAYRNRRRVVLLIAGTSSLAGFASVSIAVANNVCVGDIECSLQVGDELQQAAPVFTVAATLPPTTTTEPRGPQPMAAKPAMQVDLDGDADGDAGGDVDAGGGVDTPATDPEPTATTVATSSLPPAAFGESVMLGAITNLQAAGFNVDAAKSRQADDMVATVEYWRAQGWIGDTVVIQIGTNGAVSDDTFARIMAQLPPDETPHVVFMTVKSPKRWNTPNNAIIRALPQKYPNVTILDWEYAAGFIKLCSDQIHIACGGGMAQYYADQIFLAVGRPDLVGGTNVTVPVTAPTTPATEPATTTTEPATTPPTTTQPATTQPETTQPPTTPAPETTPPATSTPETASTPPPTEPPVATAVGSGSPPG